MKADVLNLWPWLRRASAGSHDNTLAQPVRTQKVATVSFGFGRQSPSCPADEINAAARLLRKQALPLPPPDMGQGRASTCLMGINFVQHTLVFTKKRFTILYV